MYFIAYMQQLSTNAMLAKYDISTEEIRNIYNVLCRVAKKKTLKVKCRHQFNKISNISKYFTKHSRDLNL